MRQSYALRGATAALIGLMAAAAAQAGTLTLVGVVTVQGTDICRLGGLGYISDTGLLQTTDVSLDPYTGAPVMLLVRSVDPLTGNIVQTSSLPGTFLPSTSPAGLEWISPERTFVTCDTAGIHGIGEYMFNSVLVDVFDYQGADGGLRSKGLAHDGRYVWQAYYSPYQGHLYAIDPLTNLRVSDVLVDPYPYGLAYDGKFFWVSHHDPVTGDSYVAKYDRAGNRLERFDLPAPLAGDLLGDLAVNGQHLYAFVTGSNDIAHMLAPATPPAPPLPSGVLAQSTKAEAMVGYGAAVFQDTQTAAQYSQLPLTAALRQTFMNPQEYGYSGDGNEGDGDLQVAEVRSTARTYYNTGDTAPHNVIHALAYGRGQEDPLMAASALTLTRTLLIPASSSLPAGTEVNATGSLTLKGTLQLLLHDASTEPLDLEAILALDVKRTAPGAVQTCLAGSLDLFGVDGTGPTNWARVIAAGGLDIALVRQAVAAGLAINANLARLTLDGVQVPFSVPAVVGQPFNVDILIQAYAFVPAWAEGWGAEVAFGQDPVLSLNYLPLLDMTGYSDGYEGEPPIPEPSCLALLVAGALLVRRRT